MITNKVLERTMVNNDFLMHNISIIVDYQLKNLVSDNLYGDSTFNMSAGAPQPHRRR